MKTRELPAYYYIRLQQYVDIGVKLCSGFGNATSRNLGAPACHQLLNLLLCFLHLYFHSNVVHEYCFDKLLREAGEASTVI